jgi:Flp pilus assembly protein CpaB
MLAALFGVLSAGLMFAFLNSRGGDGGLNDTLNSGDGAESVAVVSRDIAVGETITDKDVVFKTIPATALLEGRLSSSEDILGKVATAPMFAGEQVLAAKVTRFEDQTTLAYKISDPKLRAVGLQVPHEAWVVGGLVQPGDRVDVLGVSIASQLDPLTGQEKTTILSGVIAQNVEVLAVKQTLVRRIPNLDERAKKAKADGTATADGTTSGADSPVALKEGETGTYETAISITLALTPEQAAKVGIIDVIKDDQAQYRIMVRQKGDQSTIEGQITWSIEDVFDTKKK